MKKKSRYRNGMLIAALILLLLNVLGCFRPFCNFYKKTVYGFLSDGLGLLTGWIPFALGEILMYLGALWLIVFLALVAGLPVFGRREGYKNFFVGAAKATGGLVMALLLLYTLNWVLPIRADTLKVEGSSGRQYTVGDLQKARNYLVEQINDCVGEIERGQDGNILYPWSVEEEVFCAVRDLEGDYPLLGGYYPPVKKALCSDFLSWMDIGGYTYPYTMEITCSRYVDPLYYPSLVAHEAIHHQGYYLESEATFLSFLSCSRSDNTLLRYSGYSMVYYYVQGDLTAALLGTMELDEAKAYLRSQPALDKQYFADREYAQQIREENYAAAAHPAQAMAPAAGKVSEVGWKTQADLLQEANYGGAVGYLLEYLDAQGILD